MKASYRRFHPNYVSMQLLRTRIFFYTITEAMITPKKISLSSVMSPNMQALFRRSLFQIVFCSREGKGEGARCSQSRIQTGFLCGI